MKRRLLAEEIRILENHLGTLSVWDLWGPYVSERAWGTVREDYSESGDAWNHFTYDMARARVPRWGEDGIAGICDRYQIAALTFAFWNHNDPYLKERLFGLNPDQANHGEDVKEIYFHLDNTPTHSYMKYLYKYPQKAFPYEQLIQENKKRTKDDPEYELYDTGVFKEGRYFDIEIEFAKISPEDIVIKIQAFNRGPEEALLDIVPQLTFRNVWSWTKETPPKPKMWKGGNAALREIIFDDGESLPFPMLDVDYRLGRRYLYGSDDGEIYFTENETNLESLRLGKNASPYVRDAFHRKIVNRQQEAINPKGEGTRGCFHFKDLRIPAKGSVTRFLRLASLSLTHPLANAENLIQKRKEEAESYFQQILTPGATNEEKWIQKRAISSQLWNRQLYLFIANYWIKGDEVEFPGCRGKEVVRNLKWQHLVSKHVIMMPDKWEYPWFAAWDLALHAVTVALYDLALAKDQLCLLLTEQFQHPNGQIPAYEWEFSDLNPPIQAACLLMVYELEIEQKGVGDLDFLQKMFEKLVINFVWWVNREDAGGCNVFEGGFLGLDNIAVIDRSRPIPGGGMIEQSDGTGWMGLFCLNMMRIALILSKRDKNFEPMVTKFFQHFIYIAVALNKSPKRTVQNWDDVDGFFYDVLSYPDGRHEKIPVRSLVGIIPLFAIDGFLEEDLRQMPTFYEKLQWFQENRPDLLQDCVAKIEKNAEIHYVFSLVSPHRIERVLEKVWNQDEFRSEFGLRSLSKFHEKHPYKLLEANITYTPGESTIGMYGGNSNWRGPIWMPLNFFLFKNLRRVHSILGEEFTLSLGGEKSIKIEEVANAFGESILNLFKKGSDGIRPIYKDIKDLQAFGLNEEILFYEYFHGDTGKGLGASHQCGWSALVANIIHELRKPKGSL